MATLLPQTAAEALKTTDGSKSINLIKPLHEFVFDFLSFLGLATAVFGIYTISLSSTSETLQCVPNDVHRYSDYRSVKDYVNGKCAGEQLVLRAAGYSYFMFLIWFFIGLLQLWYRIPKVNGKLDIFHEYVLQICTEPEMFSEKDHGQKMKDINKSDKLFENFLALIQLFAESVVYKTYLVKLVLQAILSTLVYWVIELVLFRSWIHNRNSCFSCKISCQSFEVVNCEFLLGENARGISTVNLLLTSAFAVLNIVILFKTFFRVWFNSSDFPLHNDTMTLKQRFCFDSFAELCFLLMLLKQHNNLYSRVLRTMKLFIPHEVKYDVDEERKSRKISAQTFRKMLNGVWSGEIRFVNYKNCPSYKKDVVNKNRNAVLYLYKLDYHESEEQALYKLLRTYGLEAEGEDAHELKFCICKTTKAKVSPITPIRTLYESEELIAAAAQLNILIVLAETRQDYKRTTGIELQFVLPPELEFYATSKTLLCPVKRDQYKVLKITGAPSFEPQNQEEVISLEAT